MASKGGWSFSPGGSKKAGETVGAVVIGGDYQGLGIVRSLGRKRVPICVIDDEPSIARFSRYTVLSERVPDLRNPTKAVEVLFDVARRFRLDGWVLYPTRDELVAALSVHRSELSKTFRVPTPPWNTIQWIWDKRNTYRLASDLGIPSPPTWSPASIEELESIDWSFPVALKPAIKEHFFYATKAKAWRANDRKELRQLFCRASDIAGPGEVLIQDLIPGDGRHQFAYCAFFKDGNAVGSMVARRRRQHPYEFGRASTFVETIDLPALETLSDRFLRAIDYYGLVEVEYKLDPRDGQFKLLDVNARTWGYHTLGSQAGVDFPHLVYSDQIGLPVEACRGIPGASWIRLATDIPTGLTEIFSGRLSLADYVRSVRQSQTEAVFSFEDPVPALAECTLLPYLALKRGF